VKSETRPCSFFFCFRAEADSLLDPRFEEVIMRLASWFSFIAAEPCSKQQRSEDYYTQRYNYLTKNRNEITVNKRRSTAFLAHNDFVRPGTRLHLAPENLVWDIAVLKK